MRTTIATGLWTLLIIICMPEAIAAPTISQYKIIHSNSQSQLLVTEYDYQECTHYHVESIVTPALGTPGRQDWVSFLNHQLSRRYSMGNKGIQALLTSLDIAQWHNNPDKNKISVSKNRRSFLHYLQWMGNLERYLSLKMQRDGRLFMSHSFGLKNIPSLWSDNYYDSAYQLGSDWFQFQATSDGPQWLVSPSIPSPVNQWAETDDDKQYFYTYLTSARKKIKNKCATSRLQYDYSSTPQKNPTGVAGFITTLMLVTLGISYHTPPQALWY